MIKQLKIEQQVEIIDDINIVFDLTGMHKKFL